MPRRSRTHGPRRVCYAALVPGDSALPERPRAPRRLAAGAWHVLAGFGFLLRRPRLWPLALLPAILARPGPPRPPAAGPWPVLAGFGFLLRRPRLWPLALLPAILAAVCLGG